MNERKQGSTGFPYQFFMASSADHVTGMTGLSPSVQLSKNGGAFSAAAGSVSELGYGWYSLAGNAVDRSGLGGLAVHATAAGCDPFDGKLVVVPWDPFDSNFGLAALPAAAAGTAGGLPIVDSNNAVKLQSGTGANQINLSGGSVTVGTVSDKTGYSLTQTFPANFTNLAVTPAGSVTVGTVSDKTGYSLTQTFPANFTNLAVTPAGSVTVGTVTDKTGYSLTQTFPANFTNLAVTPAGSVTVGTVNDKTGYSLTQTFPANFTNLAVTPAGSVTVGTVNDKTGYQMASGGLDSVVIEPGVNARQALSLVLATSVGTISGASTNLISIQGGNSTTTRITATVDPAGNRSNIVLTTQ